MATPDADLQAVFSKGEESLGMMRKGREFTDELKKENERLRLKHVQMEKELLDLRQKAKEPKLEALLAENAALMEKIARLEKRFSEMERENQDLANKYVQITQQNQSLANLYGASHQLHSTLDPQEVMGIVSEILVNLVGAKEFAIFVVDKITKELRPVAGEGIFLRLASGELVWEESILEQVIKTGEAFYHDGQTYLLDAPLACVPLKIKQEVVGAIAIFRLLVEKKGFTSTDSEILNLLAGQAATAVVSSRLYDDAERKLKTIEGFIELLRTQAPLSGAKLPTQGVSGSREGARYESEEHLDG